MFLSNIIICNISSDRFFVENGEKNMVMNSETRIGRSENSNNKSVGAENLTPETSEDESRKINILQTKVTIFKHDILKFPDSKKNLSKPKNGKIEFEGKKSD